jgi:hypothetical protein
MKNLTQEKIDKIPPEKREQILKNLREQKENYLKAAELVGKLERVFKLELKVKENEN